MFLSTLSTHYNLYTLPYTSVPCADADADGPKAGRSRPHLQSIGPDQEVQERTPDYLGSV